MNPLPFHNLTSEKWNPGASMPLIMPINLVCNTPDEIIYGNMRINSRGPWPWLSSSPAHDGIAVMVGSGPSLADTIEQIRVLRDAGAHIFAMNGAAGYLSDRGILADFQVIIDARPETAELIGPARMHLIASQCAPETFLAADEEDSETILWHLAVPNIDDALPETQPEHCIIGGSASVGNTALCLAYAMGYRRLEIFGYDSSCRGEASHAAHQRINDGEPMAEVWYRGTVYRASLTMKLQAEKFQETAKDLIEAGASLSVHGAGLLPAIWHGPKGQMSEVEKYRAMWSFSGYREVSPGEQHAQTFCALANIPANATVVDFGCGTGRGALAIQRATGCSVILTDFAENCRDLDAEALPFVRADLSCDTLPVGDVGYCCDVMEHIPPHQVDTVLGNIMAHVPSAFFNIDFGDDICGAMIGEKLHLSIDPHEWWLERFIALGYRVEWSQNDQRSGQFYVTH